MNLTKSKLSQLILAEYVEDYSFELGLKSKTIKNKREILTKFLNWLGRRSFSADSCREYLRFLRRKGYQVSSIDLEIRTIKAVVRFLYKRGYLDKDFTGAIPSLRIPRKPLKLPTAEQAEKAIIVGTKSGPGDNSINRKRKKEYRAALRFILRTGLRNREVRDLRGEDINLDDESFVVRSKSGNLDRLPLPRDMIKEVKSRVSNDRLFPKLRAERLNICLKRGCNKVRIKSKVTVHTLRHIFCTTLLKKQVPLQVVSRLMRHSSVAITDRVYSHYLIDDLSRALNSSHPLIRSGLNLNEVFDELQRVVRTTGIQTDNRFKVIFKQAKNKLIMKFKYT